MSVIAFEEIFNSSSSSSKIEKPYTFTAMLIHGLLGCRDDFVDFAKSLVSSLSTDWRMVVVDLRNHGSSVDREDVVIGHSVGGKIALQYASSCAHGDYGDSAQLPKQVWALDCVPGKVENKSHYEEMEKVFHTLQTLRSPIQSQEWLVEHLMNLGFSKFLSEWISSSLKKSGEHMTFSFDIDGVIHMFESTRNSDYWLLLEEPPKGIEICVVRSESRVTWDPNVVKRLESLASRENDESRGKVSVHVVPRSGHWIYKDEPERLLEVMTPKIASLIQPKL
ncbi:unnamed protein product [Lactuca saligna]|uniref:AB hydrolase-1 domain-containing protein n=1 Tax=Lactuca saligna TaxID=75948 RepID=A0AA35ZT42_LACSI|nr:unnamed protein product [Lactuca saligna]